MMIESMNAGKVNGTENLTPWFLGIQMRSLPCLEEFGNQLRIIVSKIPNIELNVKMQDL